MKILQKCLLSLCIATLTLASSIIMGMDSKARKTSQDVKEMSDAECCKLIIKAEDTFRITLPNCQLPLNNPRAKALLEKQAQNATKFVNTFKSVSPVFSEKTYSEAVTLLHQKQQNGSDLEKKYYVDKTPADIMCRIYEKRPYAYCGIAHTTLCNGDKTMRQQSEFGLKNIGTNKEQQFYLPDYLSLAERKISEKCGLSCETPFINSGNINNYGRNDFDKPDAFQAEGLVTVMGTIDHNSRNEIFNNYVRIQDDICQNGDLLLQRAFFDEKLIVNQRISDLVGQVFNAIDFKETIRGSFYDALTDANNKAKEKAQHLYYHIPAWNNSGLLPFNQTNKEISDVITQCFLEVIIEIVQTNGLDHITVVNCGSIGPNTEQIYQKLNPDLSNCITTIDIVKRNSSKKLSGNYEKLTLHRLCFSNGFSLVGNKFWAGKLDKNHLSSSEEAAAACSSYISAIMNPKINPLLIAAVRQQAERYQAQLDKQAQHLQIPQPMVHQQASILGAQAALTAQQQAAEGLLTAVASIRGQEKHIELINKVAAIKTLVDNTKSFDEKNTREIESLQLQVNTILEQQKPKAMDALPDQAAQHTQPAKREDLEPQDLLQATIGNSEEPKTPNQADAALVTQRNAVAQLLTRAQALPNQAGCRPLISSIEQVQQVLEKKTAFEKEYDAILTHIATRVSRIEQQSITTNTTTPDSASQAAASFSTTQKVLLGSITSLTVVGGILYWLDKIPTALTDILSTTRIALNEFSMPTLENFWKSIRTSISNLWSNESSSFAISEW